jgi:hypothetical protein
MSGDGIKSYEALGRVVKYRKWFPNILATKQPRDFVDPGEHSDRKRTMERTTKTVTEARTVVTP